MKRFFLLTFLLAALGVSVFAQSSRSMLKLRLSDRSLISVNLDGRYIDQQTTQLTLDGLRPGAHRLEVYADAGIHRRPARIYTGTLRLQPGTVNVGIVDVYERGLRLRTRPMDERDYADESDGTDSTGGQPHTNRNDYEQDDRRNYGSDEVYGNDRKSEAGHSNSNSSESSGSFPHGRTGSNTADGSAGLSQRDMDDLRSRVADRITDSDKEQLMKSVLQSRTASTEQIREMLAWLSFDSTRLEFAKWSYSRVNDPRNYRKLEDAFSFDSSKEDFSKFISGH